MLTVEVIAFSGEQLIEHMIERGLEVISILVAHGEFLEVTEFRMKDKDIFEEVSFKQEVDYFLVRCTWW